MSTLGISVPCCMLHAVVYVSTTQKNKSNSTENDQDMPNQECPSKKKTRSFAILLNCQKQHLLMYEWENLNLNCWWVCMTQPDLTNIYICCPYYIKNGLWTNGDKLIIHHKILKTETNAPNLSWFVPILGTSLVSMKTRDRPLNLIIIINKQLINGNKMQQYFSNNGLFVCLFFNNQITNGWNGNI